MPTSSLPAAYRHSRSQPETLFLRVGNDTNVTLHKERANEEALSTFPGAFIRGPEMKFSRTYISRREQSLRDRLLAKSRPKQAGKEETDARVYERDPKPF